jgi:hypothetical protein
MEKETFQMPELPKVREGYVYFMGLCQRQFPHANQQAFFAFVLPLCAKCQLRMIGRDPAVDWGPDHELLCADCNRGPNDSSVLYLLPEGGVMKPTLSVKVKFERVEDHPQTHL